MGRRSWECNRDLRPWSPPVNLYETDEAFVLEADLPGVNPEDVRVEVIGDDLLLQGQRVVVHSRCDGRFHTMERSTGQYTRRMTLPHPVDQDGIQV